MRPEELRAALAVVGWSERHLAALLDRDKSQVQRWLRDEGSVPAAVTQWLRQVAAFHAAHPPPVLEKQRA